jgi:aminoglycoside phosphotransferase (APT) family kinase protein
VDRAAHTWVLDVLGAKKVLDLRSLAFGVTSDLRLIEVDGTQLVLRRYLTNDVIDESPQVVAHEAHALHAARSVLGKLVPEPIAFDITGAQAGHPSLLMTFLPGRPIVHNLDPRRMAAPLVQIHEAGIPNGLSQCRLWFDLNKVGVPKWTAAASAWATLVAAIHGPEPEGQPGFLHRDYHPGNLLWDQGELVGIVDWPVSCCGPRGIDVAHTRGNLALVDGADAADAFLTAYRDLVPAYDHHPWWDAADLLSFDDDFRGVIAFNAFGAKFDLDLLRARADDWARVLAQKL